MMDGELYVKPAVNKQTNWTMGDIKYFSRSNCEQITKNDPSKNSAIYYPL